MKVGIVANALGSQHGGDETHFRNLIDALAVVDPDGDYTLFHSTPLREDLIPVRATCGASWCGHVMDLSALP